MPLRWTANIGSLIRVRGAGGATIGIATVSGAGALEIPLTKITDKIRQSLLPILVKERLTVLR